MVNLIETLSTNKERIGDPPPQQERMGLPAGNYRNVVAFTYVKIWYTISMKKRVRTEEQKIKEAIYAKERYHNNKEYRDKKKSKMKEWSLKNKDKINEYEYKRNKTPERMKQKAEAQARYRKKMKELGLYKVFKGDRTKQSRNWRNKPQNKIKKYAHQKVNVQIKKGNIKKLPCEVCNKLPAMAHHDDYSKPLQIRWLCAKHHYDYHQSLLDL